VKATQELLSRIRKIVANNVEDKMVLLFEIWENVEHNPIAKKQNGILGGIGT
jgi:hypothetical protein